MPGTKLFYVDTDDYSISEDTAEGIAVFPDRLCAIIAGYAVNLNGPYFLSKEDAESWIAVTRNPTLAELLDAAEWHDGFPEDSGKFYVLEKNYFQKTFRRVAFFNKENETPGFYHKPSGSTCQPRKIEAWTEYPVVEVAPWPGELPAV